MEGVHPELLRCAVAALADAGLQSEEPVSVGDLHQRGEGTCYVIGTATGNVIVSTLGPHFSRGLAEPGAARRARDALVSAGFREIDDVLAAIRFEGLAVYHFGDRRPLEVGELLLCWQDRGETASALCSIYVE